MTSRLDRGTLMNMPTPPMAAGFQNALNPSPDGTVELWVTRTMPPPPNTYPLTPDPMSVASSRCSPRSSRSTVAPGERRQAARAAARQHEVAVQRDHRAQMEPDRYAEVEARPEIGGRGGVGEVGEMSVLAAVRADDELRRLGALRRESGNRRDEDDAQGGGHCATNE